MAGMCFLCKATKQDLPHNGLDRKLEAAGHETPPGRASKRFLSPVCQYPFFKQACLKLDWLHLADQGVTAYFAGSILCLFVDPPSMPNFGATILWHLLQHFYREEKLRSDRLKCLPVTRYRHKPPFLKAQAATVRKMVPWLLQLLKHLDAGIDEHRMVITGMVALGDCYKCLSNASFSTDYLKQQAAIFGRNGKPACVEPWQVCTFPQNAPFPGTLQRRNSAIPGLAVWRRGFQW